MSDEKIKRMPIKEFREQGYLQELNRRFLHPLGLALEVIVNEDGTEALGGIWDYRDDPEGILYDLARSDAMRLRQFQAKANYVENMWLMRCRSRRQALGTVVERIPEQTDPTATKPLNKKLLPRLIHKLLCHLGFHCNVEISETMIRNVFDASGAGPLYRTVYQCERCHTKSVRKWPL